MHDIEYTPIAALNQYIYCPHRCWRMFCAGEFFDNQYTIKGTSLHERVHTFSEGKRNNIRHSFSVEAVAKNMYVAVSYDVPEDKRRTKIHKVLKSYGQWVQLSVFECHLTAPQYAKLRFRLSKLISKIVCGFTFSAVVVKEKLSGLVANSRLILRFSFVERRGWVGVQNQGKEKMAETLSGLTFNCSYSSKSSAPFLCCLNSKHLSE